MIYYSIGKIVGQPELGIVGLFSIINQPHFMPKCYLFLNYLRVLFETISNLGQRAFSFDI